MSGIFGQRCLFFALTTMMEANRSVANGRGDRVTWDMEGIGAWLQDLGDHRGPGGCSAVPASPPISWSDGTFASLANPEGLGIGGGFALQRRRQMLTSALVIRSTAPSGYIIRSRRR